MERWLNRVAVVTGASSGIGAACCKELLAKGMVVVGLARRLERMEQLKEQLPVEEKLRFHPQHCDVAQEQDIKRAFTWVDKQLGGADVLVNNAGILRYTQLVADNNTADLKAILEVNVLGVALCTREAFRSMKRRGVDDGHVLIVNSVAGHNVPYVGDINFNMYAPSKYAITAMTEVLRQEFIANKTNIKITSLSPGAVDTEIFQEKQHLPSDMSFLRSEDIANAIWYCIQTPPHMQVHDIIIKPVGERF